MSTKRRILFLVGGTSGEHEISLISSKHVLKALDRIRYEPLIVIIQKNGEMVLGCESDFEGLSNNPRQVKTPSGPLVALRPYSSGGQQPAILVGSTVYEFDIAFPLLHGPGGEDGTVQGLFEFSRIPVVGCDVKASAVCMDKGFTKRLCQLANIPVAPYEELYRGQESAYSVSAYPVFVKPARLGSSLGVSKVKDAASLKVALSEAFKLDSKVLVEKAIEGREIEVAILGSREDLLASPAGEIRCRTEFYSYDAKYVQEDAAELILPATLSSIELSKVQALAKQIFCTLECHGMARIDFFMTPSGEFLLNEINTIPGFTPISMYPKLMGLAGVPYSELISRLIELAHR